MDIEQKQRKEIEQSGDKVSEKGGAGLEGSNSGEKGKSAERANSNANSVLADVCNPEKSSRDNKPEAKRDNPEHKEKHSAEQDDRKDKNDTDKAEKNQLKDTEELKTDKEKSGSEQPEKETAEKSNNETGDTKENMETMDTDPSNVECTSLDKSFRDQEFSLRLNDSEQFRYESERFKEQARLLTRSEQLENAISVVQERDPGIYAIAPHERDHCATVGIAIGLTVSWTVNAFEKYFKKDS